MKYVVYGKSDEVVSICNTEAEAIVERDKEIGRRVYLRPDDHPDVVAKKA